MQLQEDATPSILPALHIALEHPALSSSPSILCAAAPVCKDWRQAVQQCAACNTDVMLVLSSYRRESVLPMVTSFARWLPQHRALVRSMDVTADYNDAPMHLVQAAIQVAAAEPEAAVAAAKAVAAASATGTAVAAAEPTTTTTASAASTTAAAAATLAGAAAGVSIADELQLSSTGQQQAQLLPLLQPRGQPRLRLNSFRVQGSRATSMIAVLPPHSLTRLCITLNSNWPEDAAALSAALARLRSLQELNATALPASCLPAVGQLSRLTQLSLLGTAADADPAMQQLLAMPLPLQRLHLGVSRRVLPVLDMSRLTQLVEFTSTATLAADSVLPQQLQYFDIDNLLTGPQLAAVLPLQQLTRLRIKVGFQEQHPLLRLTELPQLQQLRLEYNSLNNFVSTAPAWPQLPQLPELEAYICVNGAPTDQLEAAWAGLAAATTLTELCLSISRPAAGERVAVCGRLARLTGLKFLELEGSAGPVLEHGDVLALTALTGLTHLELYGAGLGVNSLAASALACNLTQLCDLRFIDCDLGDMACLAPIAHLTQLTWLCLCRCGDGLTEQGLMLLTRLSGLDELEYEGCGSCKLPADMWDRFWEALRGAR